MIGKRAGSKRFGERGDFVKERLPERCDVGRGEGENDAQCFNGARVLWWS